MIHNDQSTPGIPSSYHRTNPPAAPPMTNPGDDQWIGGHPPIPLEPPSNLFRVVFNNVNSLGSHHYRAKIQELANTQQHLDIDYLGITEHCLNANQHEVVQNLRKSLQLHNYGQYILQINSGQMRTNTPYLPGGTAALVMGHTIGRIEPNGRQGDNMGRWSYVTFRRRQKPPLTIYTIYQVNSQPTNDIGITAWHQQRLSLDSQQRHSTHPRTAFIEDLTQSVHRHQQQNHDIILGGDFNDTLFRSRSNILKLATATGLVDPWVTLFPDQEHFSTYYRGTQRIDSILCTPGLIPLITNLAYSPYNWVTNSDHRAILLDLNEKELFGGTTDPLPSPIFRGIRSNDRQNVAKFIEQWHRHLAHNSVFARMETIKDNPLTPDEIERIDRIIGQGGDSAERRCRKRRPTMYSNTISRLRTLKSTIHGHLRTLHRGRSQTNTFQTRLTQHGIDYHLASTSEEVRHQLDTIRTELNEALKSHREQRAKEQEDLIKHAISSGKHNRASAITTIKRQEARRRVWQTLQYARTRHGDTQRRLDRLEIPASWPPPFHDPTDIALEDPKTCTAWTIITDPDAIEHYLQLRNRLHFGQAQGTPFTESPFVESLDWPATSASAEAILAGDYTTTISTVPQCQALIDSCRTVSELDLIPAEITPDAFAGKIKSWKETTSTSPSGRHLGRYKALFARGPYDPKSEDEQSQHQQLMAAQQDIASAILSIINACILTGHVLERWKTIVNTMIFKDIGNFKVHRLRVIHIYEADFNLFLAIKWRQLLHSAEQRHAIHQGLFGGRPGCEAQSLTFLEELKYDISYTTRRTLFNFDNDATSCYDRIIVSLASLINRRYGQHRKVVTVHATTLNQAKFHLRTQTGYSDSFYSHCVRYPIYGSGQGSGNSPSIWLFISSTLCDVHATNAHGATFTSPDNTATVRLTMVGFVDDSTGTCNDFQPQSQSSLETIASRMQEDAQTWNDLLWCSGGKLELTKCSYHALHFQFKPNGAPLPNVTIPPGLIQILDAETNCTIPIPVKQPFDPHKTLGHWKSPADPRQIRQLDELTRKSIRTMTTITTSPLTRFGAMIAYHSVYLPAIQYTLPQSFFTKQSLYKAERKSAHKILAKCGFNRNIAIAIRYAPLSFAGCGFVQWYTLQGEGQILLFMKHWRTTTIISETLRIALSWSQWQSGTATAILTDTRTTLPHLESRWIKSLRTFLLSINATLSLDNAFTVPRERQHDQHIMDYVVNSGNFSQADIVIINYCRLYLHVTTISELFDASGERILPNMFRCFRPAWFNTDRYITIQPKPSEYQIRKKWQKLCRHWSTEDGRIAASVHLGSWAPHDTRYHSRRESYFSDCTHTKLYHWIDSTFWLLRPINGKPHYFNPGHSTSWQPDQHSIPVDLQRIPTSEQPQYLLRFPVLPHHTGITTTSQEASTNFHHLTTNATSDSSVPVEAWDRLLLQATNLTHDNLIITDKIQEAMANRHALLLTFSADTTQNDGYCTYTWILGTRTGERLAWKRGYLQGKITTHRANLWAHLSAIRFLYHRMLAHNSTSSTAPPPASLRILATSDYSPAITSLKHRRQYPEPYPNATLKKDWDLIETIHTTYNAMPLLQHLYLKWTRIQDHHLFAKPNTLSRKLQFVVDARKLSDAPPLPHEDVPASAPSQPFLPAGRCNLHIGKELVTDKYKLQIRLAASIPELHAYLRQKNKWNRRTARSINWDWFKQAVRSYGKRHNHLTKLVYEMLPTATHQKKTGGQTWLPTTCRHCGSQPETFDHLLRCHHPHADKFRSTLVAAITKHCTQRSIPRTFRTTIVTSLIDWFLGVDPTSSRPTTHPAQIVLTAQRHIGWDKFLRGFLATQWQTFLEDERCRSPHLAEIPYDPDYFFAKLIHIMWTHQTEFWTEYQISLHSPSPPQEAPASTANPPDEQLRRYQLEARYLYSLRNEVLHHHRNTYFPARLSKFLQHSSLDQVKHYVENYRASILHSVRANQQQRKQSKPIWEYCGFSRKSKSTIHTRRTSAADPDNSTPDNDTAARPPLPSSPPQSPLQRGSFLPRGVINSANQLRQTILTYAPLASLPPPSRQPPPPRQERVPHKHSKWKASVQTARDRFRAFFQRRSQTHQHLTE